MALPGAAGSQSYPDRPIRFIVPFAPGGGNDMIARLVGGKLTESWGQQIIVDNRPGAGGNIAAEIAARSNPDGYTIFLFNSTNAIAVSLYKQVPFDPIRDFEPVILIATSPFALVVHPSTPAGSVKELIALAKTKPGVLTFASGGNGSSTHLAAEEFQQLAGIRMIHVPYKGGGPALIDVIGGRVTMYFASIPPSLPHIKTGRVRALGITSKERSPLLPDVPTISETALPGFESGASYGIVAPTHTPKAIVQKMNAEVARLLATPEVSARLRHEGLHIAAGSPQDFSRFMKAEIAQWARVVKASDAKVD
ncbi:MAG: tripartite tricarboxylate transporter substrate binding protein [Betaproteobacteria bacterium]|nr:tripartite tricarboxylate transporter substrate binding protein [Betaproteobacteria bacterium]